MLKIRNTQTANRKPQTVNRTGGGGFGQWAMILLLKIFGIMPLYAVTALVVPFYMLFARKGFFSIYHFFRKQFGFSPLKSFLKTYQNHFLFGQVILDRFAVFSGKKNLFDVEIVGNELFTTFINAEKGFVIVGSHIGNFEIAGYLLYQNKKRIHALIFGGETETVRRNRTKILNNNNITLVPVVADMSHLFAASVALQNGEIVSMPADRVFGSSKSVECAFLGGRADFPVGAFVLAKSANVEILAVFCVKISAKKYRIFVKKIEQKQNTSINNTPYAVRNFVSELEKIVKKFPEQWFNYYDFWN